MPAKRIANQIIESGKFDFPIKAKEIVKHFSLKLYVIPKQEIRNMSFDDTCCSYLDADKKALFVAKGMTKQRTRMSILHEVGHYALEHKRHTLLQENQAYEFACELMMPKKLLKADLKLSEGLTFKDIDRISQKYMVSMEASAIWCTKTFHKPYALKRITPLGVAYNGGKYRELYNCKENADKGLLKELRNDFKVNENSFLKSDYFYRSRSFSFRFPNTYIIKDMPAIEDAWHDKKDNEGYLELGTPDYKKHFAMCRYLKESDSLLVLIKEE